jgi:hypothetical protein
MDGQETFKLWKITTEAGLEMGSDPTKPFTTVITVERVPNGPGGNARGVVLLTVEEVEAKVQRLADGLSRFSSVTVIRK